MLQKEVVFYFDKAREIGKEESKAEITKGIAIMMIQDGKPVDEIERYSGKTFEELTEIAASLNKKLILPKKTS